MAISSARNNFVELALTRERLTAERTQLQIIVHSRSEKECK